MDAGGVGIYMGEQLNLMTIDRAGYSDETISNGHPVPVVAPQEFLGTLFMNSTQALGFSTDGTTMALACFAKPGGPFAIDKLEQRPPFGSFSAAELRLPPPAPKKSLDFVRLYRPQITKVLRYAQKYASTLDSFREKKYEYPDVEKPVVMGPAVQIASETQRLLEEEMVRLALLAKAKTGAPNLCVAGRTGLSCVTNRILQDLGVYEGIFVQPAASDEGLALGAALLGYYQGLKGQQKYKMSNAYLGREYPESEIKDPARVAGFEKGRSAGATEVARLLSEGKIIGRFFGRSEFGPRALGNRSILADPREKQVSERINRDIKQREWFRPFAPACTIEKRDEYFEMPVSGPFMIFAAPLRSEHREKLAAISHVDNSSRPQTVDRAENPEYYELLKQFGKISGYEVLLNTSFNSKSEPIVETPLDAFLSALEIGLDFVYIEGILYEVPQASQSHVEGIRMELGSEKRARYRMLIEEMVEGSE